MSTFSSSSSSHLCNESANNHIELPKELQSLVDLCSKVTRKSLSCRTLASSPQDDVHDSFVPLHPSTNNTNNEEQHHIQSTENCGQTSKRTSTSKEKDSSNKKEEDSDDENPTAIQDEIEIRNWLDAQIAEYQAAIARYNTKPPSSIINRAVNQADETSCNIDDENGERIRQNSRKRPLNHSTNKDHHDPPPSKKTSKNNNDNIEEEIKELKQRLFNQTVNMEQENLLFHRMLMARSSQLTLYGTNKSNSNNKDTSEQSRRILINEALEKRDANVLEAIKMKRKNDHFKERVDGVSNECRSWINKNLNLWNEIMSLPSNTHDENNKKTSTTNKSSNIENDDKANNIKSSRSSKEKEDEKRLRQELHLMNRCYLDIITASGVDWYSDSRLSTNMEKVSREM